MLVLSRKPGQTIVVGEDTYVEILQVSGRRVKIGITSSPNVPIRRGELSFEVPVRELNVSLNQER